MHICSARGSSYSPGRRSTCETRVWNASAHGFAYPQSSCATTQCQISPGCLSRHCTFHGLELNCKVLTSELCFPSVWNNTCFLLTFHCTMNCQPLKMGDQKAWLAEILHKYAWTAEALGTWVEVFNKILATALLRVTWILKKHRAHQNLQLVQTVATVNSVICLQLPECLMQRLLIGMYSLNHAWWLPWDSASMILFLRKGKKSSLTPYFTKRNWMKEYAHWSLESFKGSKPIFCQEETCQILNTLTSKRNKRLSLNSPTCIPEMQT